MRIEYITSLANIFGSFRASLNQLVADIYRQANEERKELADLMHRMSSTKETITQMGVMYESVAADLDEAACDLADLDGKITDALAEPLCWCPECNYENLAGFCEECGDEVLVTDNYDFGDGETGIVCANCTDTDETDEADEPAETDEPIEG